MWNLIFYPPPMPHRGNFNHISIIISPFTIYESKMAASKVFSHCQNLTNPH